MTVLRMVANLWADDPAAVSMFYRDLLGLALLMDLGFLITSCTGTDAAVQLSVGSQGGSGTPLPVLSVEVSDLDETLQRARDLGAPVVYGPLVEPWGVRRFFLKDPAGNHVNIVSHN